MATPLTQHLSEQPPNTAGIHEGVARHSEDIFEEFKGILPFILGKRRAGPFINVTLPNVVTGSSESLLQTLTDFIWVYDLRLLSFVSAIRMRDEESGDSSLSAVLITADSAHAYFQLPWKLEFDGNDDLVKATRSEAGSEAGSDLVPREIWSQLFASKPSPEQKTFSYDRLVERFGDPEQLPQP